LLESAVIKRHHFDVNVAFVRADGGEMARVEDVLAEYYEVLN